MKKQFLNSDNMPLDDQIKRILNGTFPLPEKVEDAKKEAFLKVRAMAEDGETNRGQNDTDISICRQKNKQSVFRFIAGAGVAAAAFSCICIVNPTAAAQVPIVGHVFEKLGESLGFAGDYTNLAEPVNKLADPVNESTKPVEKSETDLADEGKNKASITISEAYCNKAALYLSLVIHSDEKLPASSLDQNGRPVVYAAGTVDFDFDGEGAIDWSAGGNTCLDGVMEDENTYAGVIRFDMGQYFAGRDIQIPQNFRVNLSLSQIVGTKLEDTSPEMPKALKDKYEAAMKENGLSTTDAAYEQFTEEEKEIEHRLYSDMWNAYYELYPEKSQFPNHYQNWWIDGPWDFEFAVKANNQDVIRKDINDLNENGLGIIAVTKTPVEITVETEQNTDYFVVILDAEGNLMTGSGGSHTVSVSGHDTSKIDVYICDYIEYMDELKGYWWSENYEERAKEKTFKQLLEERSLYHKEIEFDNE